MLGARKLELLAGLKVRGLDLRQAEMNFYMARFTMTASLSAIMTSLAYVGVIKIKIPHEMLPPTVSWQVAVFYISACSTMALSMYNLVVTSFCVVYAQGLSLRGPPGSVAKSCRIFRTEWRSVRIVLIASMLCLVIAGVSISWMKLAHERYTLADLPIPSIIISVCVFSILILMIKRLLVLNSLLRIPMHYMVEGDLTIDQNAERVDLVAEEQDRIEAAR